MAITTLDLKSSEEIVLMFLREKFMKQLRNGDLCASDTVGWILRDPDEDRVDTMFADWLVRNGYADSAGTKEKIYIQSKL